MALKKVALISLNDGMVVNVVIVDDQSPMDPEEGFRYVDVDLSTGEPYIGYVFDGIRFEKPPMDTVDPDPDEVRREEFAALPETADLLDKLRNATPEQIDNWIDNNVSTLASARAVFKAILKVMAARLR